MAERQTCLLEVVGVVDVDHGVVVGPALGVGEVEDREHRTTGGRLPAAEHPGTLERIAGERAEVTSEDDEYRLGP